MTRLRMGGRTIGAVAAGVNSRLETGQRNLLGCQESKRIRHC